LSASEINVDKSIDTELPRVVLAEVELITGAELLQGLACTVMTIPSEAGLAQPLAFVTETEYVPEAEAESCCAVAPSDHRYEANPLGAESVSELPVQIVSALPTGCNTGSNYRLRGYGTDDGGNGHRHTFAKRTAQGNMISSVSRERRRYKGFVLLHQQ
jgi:hypothetical protein